MNAEEIKKTVRDIYRNYGIAIDDIPDEDLSSVFHSYARDLDRLERDYKVSQKVAKDLDKQGNNE
tara:strand:- start:1992 stop:2186 length:195 start_codon:yes stop_codon:yes gene_type:complete